MSQAVYWWKNNVQPAIRKLRLIAQDEGEGIQDIPEIHSAIDELMDTLVDFQEYVYDLSE